MARAKLRISGAEEGDTFWQTPCEHLASQRDIATAERDATRRALDAERNATQRALDAGRDADAKLKVAQAAHDKIAAELAPLKSND